MRPIARNAFIDDPIVIDGYSQSGASPNTNPAELGSNAVLKIELDGSNAGVELADGLSLNVGSSTIRGLVINRFAQDGIVAVADGNVFEGNFIGTDVTGSSAAGNLDNGVQIRGADNIIGGNSAAARNVISGNGNNGVLIQGPGSTENRVEGNYIGIDATGTVAIGNNVAVNISEGASHNIIGGKWGCDGPCNVISGSNGTGVSINNGAEHNTVRGDFIGNDASGTQPLGNGAGGWPSQGRRHTTRSLATA